MDHVMDAPARKRQGCTDALQPLERISQMGLRVEPVTRDWATAFAEGEAVFSERFGITVEPGWIGFPEALPALVEGARREGASAWGWHFVFADDGALIGNAGWKGAPVAGTVEIGYAVAPSHQGRGVATAVVRELLDRARAAGVRTVTAHTLAVESASTAVLRHCGFEPVSALVDPEDGKVWRWEVQLRA
jgi:[ribosomal protein S5]-alanine N-acetyltransferase